jgi:alpha-1,4-digalacturonate transport system substrate-binding protein
VLVGFAGTQHPEEVARVIDYLASEAVVQEFAQRTLFIPGHLGLLESGIEYPDASEAANAALSTAFAEIPKLADQAYALQYSPYTFVLNTNLRDRLSQVIAGELTLDEAIAEVQTTVDEAIAAAEGTATPAP